MDMYAVATGASIVLGVPGYYLYFRSIFRGETKPHAFTWGTYALIDFVVAAAQVTGGGGYGSLVVLLGGIANGVIASIALKKGTVHFRPFDWACLGGAVVGVAAWVATHDALYAVCVLSLVNTLAVLPTCTKAYARPSEESVTLWAFDIARFALSLIALEVKSVTTVLFPAVIICTNIVLIGMILVRRARKR